VKAAEAEAMAAEVEDEAVARRTTKIEAEDAAMATETE